MPSRKIRLRGLTSSCPTFTPSQRSLITLSGATQEQFSSSQSGQKRTGGRGYGRGHGLDDCGVLSFSRPTPFDQTTSFASSGPHSTAGLSCSSSNGFTESASHLMSMPTRAHTHTTRQPRTPNRKKKKKKSAARSRICRLPVLATAPALTHKRAQAHGARGHRPKGARVCGQTHVGTAPTPRGSSCNTHELGGVQ